MNSPLLHLGYNNYVVTDRIAKVLPIMPSHPLATRRIRTEAREERMLINASQGKAAKTLIVLTSGHIVLSSKDHETINQLIAEGHESI